MFAQQYAYYGLQAICTGVDDLETVDFSECNLDAISKVAAKELCAVLKNLDTTYAHIAKTPYSFTETLKDVYKGLISITCFADLIPIVYTIMGLLVDEYVNSSWRYFTKHVDGVVFDQDRDGVICGVSGEVTTEFREMFYCSCGEEMDALYQFVTNSEDWPPEQAFVEYNRLELDTLLYRWAHRDIKADIDSVAKAFWSSWAVISEKHIPSAILDCWS